MAKVLLAIALALLVSAEPTTSTVEVLFLGAIPAEAQSKLPKDAKLSILAGAVPEERRIPLIQTIAESDPGNTQALLQAGFAFREAGDYHTASEAARLALARNPHDRRSQDLYAFTVGRSRGKSSSIASETTDLAKSAVTQKSPAPSIKFTQMSKKGPVQVPTLAHPRDPHPDSLLVKLFAKGSPRLGDHRDHASTWQDLCSWAEGRSLAEMLGNDGSKPKVPSGGPKANRYIADPADPQNVIDMRHFFAVGTRGKYGEVFGLGIELGQLANWAGDPNERKSKWSETVFDPQDFYSNALGVEFFTKYYDSKNPNIAGQLTTYFQKREALSR